MATYSEKKAALDDIAGMTVHYQKIMAEGFDKFTTAMNGLGAMQSDYAAIVAEITADAAAAPDDDVLRLMAEEKNKLVADFMDAKNKAIAIRDAMGPLL